MTRKSNFVQEITQLKPVTGREDDSDKLLTLFEEYRSAYTAEWERLAKCDRLYRCEHWDMYPVQDKNEPRPVTPIIQSTVENIRAELADYCPEAVVCADDPIYTSEAEALTAALRENHIACNYEEEYGDMLYDLLVGGYCVQEVGYDPTLYNGRGAAYIRHVDNRSIMFDPMATRVEDCRAIFKFSAYSRAWFAMHYPDEVHRMNFDAHNLKNAGDGVLAPIRDDMGLLIECWLREYDEKTDSYYVHMVKLAGGVKVEDTRRDYPCGLYSHGKYPFTVTTLFTRKGSCLGYGYADMFEKQQVLSDKLDQIILKNALMSSHSKMLVSSASGFDLNDLRDWSKEVHRGENINGIRWLTTAPLPAYIIDYAERMRTSVREESGANEFSRGNATGGVVAASAISALIEMSNKRARNVAKRLHNAFAEAVRMEIDTERDYADFPRNINIDPQNRVVFSRSVLCTGDDEPIEFRVTVKVQRENRFSVLSHNETIMQLVDKGMIAPDVGLELMIFDGKSEALAKMNEKRDTHGE